MRGPPSAGHEQDVAEREDVRQGRALGDGEDVAEEGHVGVVDLGGVLELAGFGLDARSPEGVAVRRHHPSVGPDGDHVAQAAEEHQEHPRKVPVEQHEPEGGDVRAEVDDDEHRSGCAGDDGDDDHLDDDRGEDDPEVAQSYVEQAAEAAPEQRDRDQPECHDGRQQHLAILARGPHGRARLDDSTLQKVSLTPTGDRVDTLATAASPVRRPRHLR